MDANVVNVAVVAKHNIVAQQLQKEKKNKNNKKKKSKKIKTEIKIYFIIKIDYI